MHDQGHLSFRDQEIQCEVMDRLLQTILREVSPFILYLWHKKKSFPFLEII